MNKEILVSVLALGLSGGSALANPIKLEYAGQVAGYSSALPAGVSEGDLFSLVVYADNGGSSLTSQSWSFADVISAEFAAGSYSASTSGPINWGDGGFSTNSLGELDFLDLSISQPGSDNTTTSTSFDYYLNNAIDILYDSDTYSLVGIGTLDPPNIGNTSISLISNSATVPIPPALPLSMAALASLFLFKRRSARIWRRA